VEPLVAAVGWIVVVSCLVVVHACQDGKKNDSTVEGRTFVRVPVRTKIPYHHFPWERNS
jgi:hypothetical protein